MVELNKPAEVNVVSPFAVTAVAMAWEVWTALISLVIVPDEARIACPMSAEVHVAEMDVNLVSPPAVSAIPSVPVAKTVCDVPPFESEPVCVLHNHVVTT
jgi:hypothetical protein